MTDSIARRVISVNIDSEMKTSYIDYAMSVIVARALPDVRDGLKPVHRRILYALHELGMTHDKPHKKSARIVGEVLGKYHPHADTSVYEAMVRLAQDFASRYPLVDGHGNFGSIDGDSPAAMRYTEVRMSPLAASMLEDIRKDTVDFVPNFDESLKEPVVLPARFPNLLANGSSGIAVGMATNIPPHNLGELVDGLLAAIEDPELPDSELFRLIKGPDFPTGGTILGRDAIREAYTTGRGVIRIRGTAEVVPTGSGRHQIIITEIPYQVTKSRLVERIAELVRERRLEGISDIRDETDRRGIRMVIELRREANPQIVLNRLYKYTSLEQTFGIILLALANGHPRTMSLREMLNHYIEHQRQVITRRTRYDLARAEERAHILAGLLIALDHIDAVIALIRASATVDDARQGLITRFSLSERQAQAILDMRLQRLAAMERKKIEEEMAAVRSAIEEFRRILADRLVLDGVIKDDLIRIKDRFADERRTRLTSDSGDFDEEDLIDEHDIIITLSNEGFIKRQSLAAFRRQLRGGRGVHVATLRESDRISRLVTTTTHRHILLFTTSGRVFKTRALVIPELGRQARGVSLTNVVAHGQDERVTALLPLPEQEDLSGRYLVLATRNGVIKKMDLKKFMNITRAGLIAIALDPDDVVVAATITDGSRDLLLATRRGRGIRFSETNVRSMGRTARGVRGIRLRGGDTVLSLVVLGDNETLLVVTEHGYGKRTPFERYRRMNRGGQGVVAARIDHRSGAISFATGAPPRTDVLLVSAKGVIIRIKASQIARQGREARGVTLMRLEPDDQVVAGLAVVQGEVGTDA